MKRFEKTSTGSLIGAVQAWKRWESWADLSERFQPSGSRMEEFTSQVAQGGPTASMATLRALGFAARACRILRCYFDRNVGGRELQCFPCSVLRWWRR